MWFGWPSDTEAVCATSLTMLQVWCLVRYILFALCCIKLAAQVMAENCSLIFQPIWNIVIKLVIILMFMILLGISLSSSSISASDIGMSMPNPSDPTQSIAINIGGVSRSFDMV